MHDFGPKEKELCMDARNQRAQLVPMMISRAPADGFLSLFLLILMGVFLCRPEFPASPAVADELCKKCQSHGGDGLK